MEEQEKKYELTDETMTCEGHTLHRIKALKDITLPCNPNYIIEKGEFGGWVEGEENLSQEGGCWVNINAMIFDNARVLENACVVNNAIVCGGSIVRGNAVVREWARIEKRSLIEGNAVIFNFANIKESIVWNNAKVGNHVYVFSFSTIGGNAQILGNSRIGNVTIEGDVVIKMNSFLFPSIHTTISKPSDILIFNNTWPEIGESWTTSGEFYYLTPLKQWYFDDIYGATSEEFIAKVYKDSKNKGDFFKMYVNLVNELIKKEEEYGKEIRTDR